MGREWGRLNLADYDLAEPIFIDANIFIDYSLPNPRYGKAVADFIEKVELGEIKAITTPLVISEVSYILLLQKGSMILGTHDRKSIRDKIKRERGFANLCYSVIDRFNELLNVLEGLKVIPMGSEDHLRVSDVGKKYGLLPNDALHLVAMRNSNIRNIATRDKDFDRVADIQVWSP